MKTEFGVIQRWIACGLAALGWIAGPSALASYQAVSVVAWGDNSYHQTNIPAGLTNPVAVAGGYYHTLVLKADGSVTAWGDGSYNQTNVPTAATGVQAISAGLYHNLVLRGDGTVLAWGRSNSGQTQVPGVATNIIAVAAGWYFSLALSPDGTVLAWGDSSYSQTNVPPGLTNVTAIAAGGLHALALRTNGTVAAWGAGTNTSGTGQNYGQSIVPASATNIIAVAGGGYHSLALRANGTVLAWGAGVSNTGVSPHYGQSKVPAGLSNVIAIAAGMQHSLALRSDGAIVAWGAGTNNTGISPSYGQSMVPAGLTNAVALAAGPNFSLALSAAGPLLWPRPAPSISLLVGGSVTLSVQVLPDTAFSTQWSRNGAPLAGATDTSLAISSFHLDQAGIYSIAVTNSSGYATADTVLRLTNSPIVLVDGVDVGGGDISRIDSFQTTMTSAFGSGAHVYYTLDGSTPDYTSLAYVGPFALSNTVVIRAIAYNAAYTESAEAAPISITVWPTYPLQLTTPGGGSVSAAPAPYDGLNRYVSNTVVTLTATAATNWSFLGWTGDNSDLTNVTTVLVDRPLAVQGIFGTSLGLSTNGNGEVRQTPTAGPYPFGSIVQLLAVPGPGSYFFGWGGAASGFTNPLSLTITNPTLISGLFADLKSNQVSLTVALQGQGTVVVNPARNVYTNGDTVLLTARPAATNLFSGWSGDASGSLNPLPLLLDTSKFLTATFVAGSPTNAPQIVQQPLSRTVAPGQSTTLSVQAVGDGPLYYQWRFNGSAIPGATRSTLTLTDFAAWLAGGYDALITGPAGSVTSQVASVGMFQIQYAPTYTGPMPLLILNGATGASFHLEVSSNLLTTNWTLLVPVTLPADAFYYIDQPASNYPLRLYRAVPQ